MMDNVLNTTLNFDLSLSFRLVAWLVELHRQVYKLFIFSKSGDGVIGGRCCASTVGRAKPLAGRAPPPHHALRPECTGIQLAQLEGTKSAARPSISDGKLGFAKFQYAYKGWPA